MSEPQEAAEQRQLTQAHEAGRLDREALYAYLLGEIERLAPAGLYWKKVGK